VRLPLSGTGFVVGAKEWTGTQTALLGQDFFTVLNIILNGGISLEGMLLSSLALTIPRVITPLLLLTGMKEKKRICVTNNKEMHFLFSSFVMYFQCKTLEVQISFLQQQLSQRLLLQLVLTFVKMHLQ